MPAEKKTAKQINKKFGCRIDVQECAALEKSERHQALFVPESPELKLLLHVVFLDPWGSI